MCTLGASYSDVLQRNQEYDQHAMRAHIKFSTDRSFSNPFSVLIFFFYLSVFLSPANFKKVNFILSQNYQCFQK